MSEKLIVIKSDSIPIFFISCCLKAWFQTWKKVQTTFRRKKLTTNSGKGSNDSTLCLHYIDTWEYKLLSKTQTWIFIRKVFLAMRFLGNMSGDAWIKPDLLILSCSEVWLTCLEVWIYESKFTMKHCTVLLWIAVGCWTSSLMY